MDNKRAIRIKSLKKMQHDAIIAIYEGLRAGVGQDEMKKLYAKRKRITRALNITKLGVDSNAAD